MSAKSYSGHTYTPPARCGVRTLGDGDGEDTEGQPRPFCPAPPAPQAQTCSPHPDSGLAESTGFHQQPGMAWLQSSEALTVEAYF